MRVGKKKCGCSSSCGCKKKQKTDFHKTDNPMTPIDVKEYELKMLRVGRRSNAAIGGGGSRNVYNMSDAPKTSNEGTPIGD